ncbi:lasso peptide isopeptide bond-forming cyclase [Marinactinospora endophytica]
MFGGIAGARRRKLPSGTRTLPGLPDLWATPTADPPIVTITENGVLVLLGLCGANREQVADAVRPGVPDDVSWRWPGAYVAVHLEDKQIRIWTSLGALPVYVRHGDDGEVIWSTSARALASLRSPLRLDLGAVAAFIKRQPIEHALFADIERLPAGHRVHLNRGGWTATPVWTPRPSPVPVARRLRRALEDAVALRVDRFENPTSDFSGGLDSTSLSLLAARRLAPTSRTIIATTLHPAGITSGGDLDYIHGAIGAPGLAHAWISRDHTHAPYSDLVLPPTDEPPVSAVSLASFRDHMRWLDTHGSGIHMTGDGGDALLVTPSVYFAETIRRHPFRTLGAASRFAQVRRMSLRQALNHGRASTLPRTGLELPSRTHHKIISTLIDSARSARADIELAAAFGVRLDNPFFDAQVIDAYLSMSSEEMPEPARYKPVLVEAMADVLPSALRHRTTKATTTADHYEGLRRSLPQVDALLDGHLAEVGLIDVPAARARMRSLAAGAGDLGPIELVVAFEAWWRALEPVPWKEAADV